ncbi:NmrA family protein (plasmid) [Sodalis praecaptivus]|uniref:NmrA family protein n=1 Tax=Sodalis praecaptivus TaxID=1239307 RepID=W0I4C1_9GAMM|nr:NmrA/HSCARG family protein [Sodalis praecaptivus]AHF79310.1 NmrA family protein [Sodalis praecaptivus]
MLTSLRPRITVVGAMSKQGRSVARTLLESQRYRVRALTRNIHSPIAQELASLGAELIEISIKSDEHAKLVAAFADSTGAFLMTPGILPAFRGAKTHETTLGCRLADAAVEAGVEHIVFSSLENVDKISEGQLWVPHFTDKGKIEEYIRTLPVGCSFIQMAFFYTNLLEYYQPRSEGGTLIFPVYLPEDFQAPFVDPLTATGPAVLAMFDNREMYTGCTLPVIGEFISPRELVETFCRVTGRKAVYRSAVTREELLHYFPSFVGKDGMVDEITGMVKYAVNYGYFAKNRDLLWSRKINSQSLTWEDYLINTGWQGDALTF